MDFKFGNGDNVSERELQYDYELHDNVLIDLIKYSRSSVVKNEEQVVLTFLGYMTGFMEAPSHYVSGVLTGTAGSGKSHAKNQVDKVFPDEYLYEATQGSEKSLIYDETWEDAYIAALDELQKIPEETIEILKSLHGGEDEEFRYKVTGSGEGADRTTDEIVRSAMPFWFLYAQNEPDFEMWDRLLKIPIHESKEKNEAVSATQWDHTMIAFGDSENDYMFDFSDGRDALTDHIREMPKNAWVKIPAGEEEFGWDAHEHAKHIFDMKRSETNRVSGMIANLVRPSTLINYKNRQKKQMHIPNEGTKTVYIAEPQDVYNIFAARDVLLATTHELDRKKKALCLSIQEAGGMDSKATIQDMQEELQQTNASFVKRHQIEQMLEDLIQNYLVEKHERTGEANLYEFKGWHALGSFEITEEFKRVFGDCIDPFTGENAVESARRINREIEPTLSDFQSESDVSSNSDGGQSTLSGTTDREITLDTEEEYVRQHLYRTLDGVTVNNLTEREPSLYQMLGIVPLDEEHDDDIDIEGTIFDPNHELWAGKRYAEDKREVEHRVHDLIKRLNEEKGVFKTEVKKKVGGRPDSMKCTVLSEDQL